MPLRLESWSAGRRASPTFARNADPGAKALMVFNLNYPTFEKRPTGVQPARIWRCVVRAQSIQLSDLMPESKVVSYIVKSARLQGFFAPHSSDRLQRSRNPVDNASQFATDLFAVAVNFVSRRVSSHKMLYYVRHCVQ